MKELHGFMDNTCFLLRTKFTEADSNGLEAASGAVEAASVSTDAASVGTLVRARYVYAWETRAAGNHVRSGIACGCVSRAAALGCFGAYQNGDFCSR